MLDVNLCWNTAFLKHQIQHFTSIFVAGSKHLWPNIRNLTQLKPHWPSSLLRLASHRQPPTWHCTPHPTSPQPLRLLKISPRILQYNPLSPSNTDNFLGPKVGMGGPNIQNYVINKRWAGTSSVTKGKIVPNESKELKTRCRQYSPQPFLKYFLEWWWFLISKNISFFSSSCISCATTPTGLCLCQPGHPTCILVTWMTMHYIPVLCKCNQSNWNTQMYFDQLIWIVGIQCEELLLFMLLFTDND